MNFTDIKNILALIALCLGTVLGWNWHWGVLFLYWVYLGIRRQEAFLLDPISQIENPLTFWLVNITWVSFGLLMVVIDFL